MQTLTSSLQEVLDVPFVRRTRRNHGLEHATIHMMQRSIPDLRVIGRSDANGFWLWGDLPTDKVEQAAHAALRRMRGGEHKLALHPNCGTNIVTTATLGAGAVLLALVGSEREKGGRLSRLPLIVTGLMLAIVAGQPLGMQLQEHVTTLGDPGDLEIVSVERINRAGIISHRITTRST
ncbi:MAG: hypothetical protein GYB64_02980 [Chloroflexi bacterium]|nr:hypothetical protein [Chloroflexota bacterium]